MWIPCLRIDWHLAWSGDQCWVRFHQLWTHKLNGRCRQGAMLGIWRKLAFTSPFLFVLWQTWCDNSSTSSLSGGLAPLSDLSENSLKFSQATPKTHACANENVWNPNIIIAVKSTLYQALLRKRQLLNRGNPKSLSFGFQARFTVFVRLPSWNKSLALYQLYVRENSWTMCKPVWWSWHPDWFFWGRHSSFKISQKGPTPKPLRLWKRCCLWDSSWRGLGSCPMLVNEWQ